MTLSHPGRLSAAAAALGAAAIAALSAALAVPEARAARLSALPPPEQVRALHAGLEPQALSLRGQAAGLMACHTALSGPGARLLPPDDRARIAARCSGLAARALRRQPRWALAHYTAALAGGPDAADRHLPRARALAPAEGWQAARRLGLALAHWPALGPAARDAARADARLLARTEAGAAELARLYRRAPVLAAALADWLEGIGAADARRVLAAIGARAG